MSAAELTRTAIIGGKTVTFGAKGASTKRTVPKAVIWKALREKCLECVGSAKLVHECDGVLTDGFCNLHPYKLGAATKVQDDHGQMLPQFRKSAMLRAIRTECIWCLGDERRDICTSPNCQLYPYRMGKAVQPSHDLPENNRRGDDFSTIETSSGIGKGVVAEKHPSRSTP